MAQIMEFRNKLTFNVNHTRDVALTLFSQHQMLNMTIENCCTRSYSLIFSFYVLNISKQFIYYFDKSKYVYNNKNGPIIYKVILQEILLKDNEEGR